ncbi:MAG: neutral/alkaline non-lysosomal ceramidase N-terminal domain-containing protein, partial [Flavobacteriales bacterium]|nr:neutral/alkaline non-lysosomal ceramidase N-terminal domain-containing protein [Flavobacteriales bacterium]
MLEVGAGKTDITAFIKGVGMMGYGMTDQTVEDVETPLSCRAFVFHDNETGKKLAFVNAEMCFVTIAIKQAVVAKLKADHGALGFSDENVMLTAQHTHSAPGGYSHYAFFNFSIPGFAKDVFDTIVNGMVDATVQAVNSLKPSKLKFGKGSFAPELNVAFNRSMPAYNANPEVEKLDDSDWHLAVDREMRLLRIDDDSDNPIGLLNWFGVHTTTVGNDNRRICFDNKGYASQAFEKDLTGKNPDFQAIFAQGPCADVMPNFIWEGKRKKMRGPDPNDFESAKFNGNLQYDKAKEIYNTLEEADHLKDTNLDCGLMYVDFSNVEIDKEFIPEGHSAHAEGASTSAACMGVAFFKGTVDGPGISDGLGIVASKICRINKQMELFRSTFGSAEEAQAVLHKYKTQGVKDIMAETANGTVLGIKNLKKLKLLTGIDKVLETMRAHYMSGGLENHPWTPQVLPLQFFTIGPIAIVGIPAEVSVVSGRRFKKTVESILKEKGITEVILSPYANCYGGYITTYEEYQTQRYEGGHTVFGEWTQAAYSTKLKYMAQEMLKPEGDR